MESSEERLGLRADVAALRASMAKDGYDTRPVTGVLLSLVAQCVVAIACVSILIVSDSTPMLVAALAGATLALSGMAAIGHTASHGAVSSSDAVNRTLFLLTYPLALFISARFWFRKHVLLHHAWPNVVDTDPDCDLRPLFTVHRAYETPLVKSSQTGRRTRLQGALFLGVIPLILVGMQLQGVAFLARELADRTRRSRETWLDGAAMLLHLALYFALPLMFAPATRVLAAYASLSACVSLVMFAALAPGHFPAAALCLAPGAQAWADFWPRQTAATINLRMNAFWQWLAAGLDRQVEHHLFPMLSHVHYARLAPRVAEICHRHGLHYREMDWGPAIVASAAVMFDPKEIIEHPDQLLATPGPAGPAGSGTSIAGNP